MNIEGFIDTLNAEEQQAALDLLWRRLSRASSNAAFTCLARRGARTPRGESQQ